RATIYGFGTAPSHAAVMTSLICALRVNSEILIAIIVTYHLHIRSTRMSIQLKPTMLRRHQLSDTFIPDNLNDYRPRNGYHLNPQNSPPLPLDMRNNQDSAQYSDVLPSLHKMAYAFQAGF